MVVGHDRDDDQQKEILHSNIDLKNLAQQELREDDESRMHALAVMRDWINKHPDITNCRTGILIIIIILL